MPSILPTHFLFLAAGPLLPDVVPSSQLTSHLQSPHQDIPTITIPTSVIMLSTLAPELILHIYKSLDDHHSITSLNTTSSQLYQVWRANAPGISDAVLQRSIDCYDDACELVRVQQQGSIGPQRVKNAYRMALDKNEQILSNHAVITLAREHSQGDRFDPLEPAALKGRGFAYAYYRLWIVSIADTNESQKQRLYLETIENTTFWLIVRLCRWLWYTCKNTHNPMNPSFKFHLGQSRSQWMSGFEFVGGVAEGIEYKVVYAGKAAPQTAAS